MRIIYVLTSLTFILFVLFFSSHCWISDGVLASQPDSSFNDGRYAQVQLDDPVLPDLRHPPPCGRHLLLPQLSPQPVPLQPLLQAVQGRVHPGSAVPPYHHTQKQVHPAVLQACLQAPPTAEVAAPKQVKSHHRRTRESAPNFYNLSVADRLGPGHRCYDVQQPYRGAKLRPRQ